MVAVSHPRVGRLGDPSREYHEKPSAAASARLWHASEEEPSSAKIARNKFAGDKRHSHHECAVRMSRVSATPP